MDRLLDVLARDLEQRSKINLDECFGDGRCSAANKEGAGVSQSKRSSRYKRRWKIERPFCLAAYRRLVTRYERDAANFLAFLELAAFSILDKKYL